MVKIAEAFHHDDRVALFMFAMCMASNDVENALDEVDETSALHGYYVRLALAHTVEGLSAYDLWLKDPEVKAFISTVDRKWSRARKTTATMRHQVGRGWVLRAITPSTTRHQEGTTQTQR